MASRVCSQAHCPPGSGSSLAPTAAATPLGVAVDAAAAAATAVAVAAVSTGPVHRFVLSTATCRLLAFCSME